MPRWTASWRRTRIESETSVRRPNEEEVKEKAKDFRKKWGVLLGLHWVAYIALFASQAIGGDLDFNFTLIATGFFSLFAHQALFILSSFSLGAFDRLMARLIGRVEEERAVRIVEEGKVRVSFQSHILSIEPLPDSFTEVDRIPAATQETSAAPQHPLEGAAIPLDSNTAVLHVVRDTNGQTILEVRDTETGARIDLAGFQDEPPGDAPVIDRQPVVLAAEDAAELRNEIKLIRPALWR